MSNYCLSVQPMPPAKKYSKTNKEKSQEKENPKVGNIIRSK